MQTANSSAVSLSEHRLVDDRFSVAAEQMPLAMPGTSLGRLPDILHSRPSGELGLLPLRLTNRHRTLGAAVYHACLASHFPLILPATDSSATAKEMPPQVASIAVEAPADRIVEQLDPLANVVPIADPPAAGRSQPTMYAGVRMLMIRRRKMRKFKHKKQQKRDAFLIEKLRLQKQAKAEAFFRARMNELRSDMENFDPLQYAKGVIKSAEREWESRLAPSGKKRYGHWSEVISLEELYGIEPSSYIDKRAGLFTAPEDRAKFAQLRANYLAKYRRGQPKPAGDEQKD